jgi:hypothetical protein
MNISEAMAQKRDKVSCRRREVRGRTQIKQTVVTKLNTMGTKCWWV